MTCLINQPFTAAELADAIPQKPPFKFVDKILSVDENEIIGTYTFQPMEFFYRGHFPGNPLTPGVILLESMAQVGLVAFGLYLHSQTASREQTMQMKTLFTDAKVEFLLLIKPGDTIRIRAVKKVWRRNRLVSEATAHTSNGIAAVAELAGMGVLNA